MRRGGAELNSENPKNRSARRRRRGPRLDRVLLAVLFLAVAVYGLVRLGGYVSELLSVEKTDREMRDLYQTEGEGTPPPAAEDGTAQPEQGTDGPALQQQEAPSVQEAEASPTEEAYIDPTLPVMQYKGYSNWDRFSGLLNKNADVIGWISAAGQLDEAVVQRDNVFYLNHDSAGKSNSNGAIFLDAMVSLKNRPYTYVLYGHNMKSGAKFGFLRNYENPAYYANDPFITLDTLYESGKYIIFSVGQMSLTSGHEHFVPISGLYSLNRYHRQAAIDALMNISVYFSPVEVLPEDQLLLLVTCTEGDDTRRVVAARRLRSGEKEADLAALAAEIQRK